MNTMKEFYSIVDESHTVLTKQLMADPLNGQTRDHSDTRWALRAKDKQKPDTKKRAAKAAPIINPPHKSTSKAAQQWAIQEFNL